MNVVMLWGCKYFLQCIDLCYAFTCKAPNCPCTCVWNEVWKQTMGKWNASEAYLLISGIQGCLLSLQRLIGIKTTKWSVGYYFHGVHGAKQQRVCGWPAPSSPCSLQFSEHISNVFLISLTFGFYLNVKRREKSTSWDGKGQLRQEGGRGTPLSGITTKAVESGPEVS